MEDARIFRYYVMGYIQLEIHAWANFEWVKDNTMPERIYNPIVAMEISAMFTFQLDNTKR